MNIYRGCTHGCIYCDSRSKCYQINHDFADIEVKEDAPSQLDKELFMKRKPCMIGTGSMTDPYNHVEKEIEYTRKCLEVILKHHCGVAIQTKSDLIIRDIDLINEINKDSKAVVEITLTTANDELCKRIEPNVCPTSKRVEVLRKCKELGIPTVVWLCPFLPFINDNEENINRLTVLKLLGLNMEYHMDEIKENYFTNKKCVLTGTLAAMGRTEAKKLIESFGGSLSESVSKKTNIVIVGDNPGSKYDKAVSLGIYIMSEAEFIEKTKE